MQTLESGLEEFVNLEGLLVQSSNLFVFSSVQLISLGTNLSGKFQAQENAGALMATTTTYLKWRLNSVKEDCCDEETRDACNYCIQVLFGWGQWWLLISSRKMRKFAFISHWTFPIRCLSKSLTSPWLTRSLILSVRLVIASSRVKGWNIP